MTSEEAQVIGEYRADNKNSIVEPAVFVEQEPIDCFCYLSKASTGMSGDDLNKLITQANSFNRANNITGVLFYWRNYFFQYLEGPSSSLEPLLHRIELDDRHTVINVLRFESTNLRRFSDWALMRVSANSEGTASLVESVVRLLSQLTPDAPADTATKTMLFGLLDCLVDSPLRHNIENEIVGKRLVVIGASAGGIAAMKDLLLELPKDIDASILIATHLSPNHKTVLHQILERESGFSVQLAEHGDLVLPGVIHLIPPTKNIEVIGGRIYISQQHRNKLSDDIDYDPTISSVPHPIDILFENTAKQYGRRVIGVVLSGSGTDGTNGAKALQEAGAIVLAQSPESAEFPSMPQSVITAGLANRVFQPLEIAKFIANNVSSKSSENFSNLTEQDTNAIDNIIQSLAESNIDFREYKRTTIVNRILRRRALLEIDELDEYHKIIVNSEKERRLLIDDLLICVTSFIRDPDAWSALKEAVVTEILPNLSPEEELRAWVAGCATGEEAYSMAMLLHEAFEEKQLPVRFKIFATDLSEKSVEHAKEGVYKQELTEAIDDHLLNKYFQMTSNAFIAKNIIKERIIWATHNLTNSPPFTNTHLVSCRNVVIYMNAELQSKVLRTFHFSLVKNGLLFLGPSESTRKVSDEFLAINRKWNIHKKRFNKKIPPHLSRSEPVKLSSKNHVKRKALTMHSKDSEENMYRKSIEAMCSAQNKTALVVGKRRTVELVVSDALGLLEFSIGAPEASLDKMLVKSLIPTVVVNLQQFQKLDNNEMLFPSIECENNHQENIKLDMRLLKLGDDADDRNWLLTCEKSTETLSTTKPTKNTSESSSRAADNYRTSELLEQKKNDLEETRAVLFDTIKELEKSKHEQQDAFQQLTTANEELQSTNEELQSVNEELYTVNFEYQSKIHELSDLTNDLENLMQCSEMGVVFVSADMTVRRLTSQAAKTAQLRNSDVGAHVSVLAKKLNYPALEDQLSLVMSLGKSTVCDIEYDQVPNRLHIGIHPYKIDSELAQGAIITLLDLASLQTFAVSPIVDNERTAAAEMVAETEGTN